MGSWARRRPPTRSAGSSSAGITEANRRASELTGYPREELVGRSMESLFSPRELARLPLAHEAVALAARLLEARTDLRVLYTTGYGDSVVARHGIVEEGLLLLEKPFSLHMLARQVRRALSA